MSGDSGKVIYGLVCSTPKLKRKPVTGWNKSGTLDALLIGSSLCAIVPACLSYITVFKIRLIRSYSCRNCAITSARDCCFMSALSYLWILFLFNSQLGVSSTQRIYQKWTLPFLYTYSIEQMKTDLSCKAIDLN